MIKDQFCSVEVNYLGHLLVGNPPVFCDHVLASAPRVAATQLAVVANGLAQSVTYSILSRSEYEDAYYERSETAVSWQELFHDNNLLNVLSLLREYVKTVECLLYIDG